MALRQMSMARMGEYRPRHDAIQKGGKTGRPKLLHNGTGHGLTGGGGLNAKGTGGGIKVSKEMRPIQRQLRKAKYAANKHNAMKINERGKSRVERAEQKNRTTGGPAMNPHPVGHFMYGDGQWGVIHKGGQVDWTSTKPVAGRPVLDFSKVLPWVQRTPHMRQVAQQHLAQRRTPPAWYIDPIYSREKAAADLMKETELSGLGHRESTLNFEYDTALRNLNHDYGQNVNAQNAQLGASGMSGSGIADASLGELASQLQRTMGENQRQNELQVADIDRLRKLADTSHGVGLTSASEMAQERWKATHQGQKPPKSRAGTSWSEGGIRFRANAQGTPMTANQKPTVKPKPKPGAHKGHNHAHGTNPRGKK